MATTNEILCEVLQLQGDASSLNYYSLLGLPVGTSDKQQITVAIQTAVSKLKAASNSHPQAKLEVTKKALQQCNAILLTPEKKAAYDDQLSKQRIASNKPVVPSPKPVPATETPPTAKRSAPKPLLKRTSQT